MKKKRDAFLELTHLPGIFEIIKDPSAKEIVQAKKNGFYFLSQDEQELSLLSHVQENSKGEKWRGFVSQGPLPFEVSGILKSFIDPLSEKDISILAVSTFSRDYIFVPAGKVDISLKAFGQNKIKVHL